MLIQAEPEDCTIEIWNAGSYAVYAEPRTEPGLVDVWVLNKESGERVWTNEFSNRWSRPTITARMYEVDSPWWKFWESTFPHFDEVSQKLSEIAEQKHAERYRRQRNYSDNCMRLKEMYGV